MTTSPEKVLELLADKRITASEADSLLAALKPRSTVPWWSWLLNPLERLSTPVTAVLTAMAIGLQWVLERRGVTYDGALDVHVAGHPIGWATSVLHLAIVLPFMAAVLWSVARAMKQAPRFIDLLLVVGLSRIPDVITGLFALRLSSMGMPALRQSGPAVLFLALASVPFAVWSIAVLCLGFRTASGLRGSRLAWGFVAAVLVAEVLSKLTLHALAPAMTGLGSLAAGQVAFRPFERVSLEGDALFEGSVALGNADV